METNQSSQTSAFPALRPGDLVYLLPLPSVSEFTNPTSETSFGFSRTDRERINVNGVWKTVIHHRSHAAVDLEAPIGTPVLAMSDGVVLRISLDFRQGTSAIEVQHPGLGIVRYGEVDRYKLGLAHAHHFVKRGQVIGFLGQRGSAPRAMLHLELFSDWHRTDVQPGSDDRLTNTSNLPFERRDDLKNPTALLRGGLQVTGLKHVTLSKPVVSRNLHDWMRLQHLLSTVCVKLTCPVSQ